MEEIGLSIQRTQCRRPACQAIRDFARLEEPLGHKFFINSATMADPSKFDPRVFDRQINHLLTLHKERHKALCDMMATVLSHDIDQYDRVEGRNYLEIASRLASLDQPGCLAQANAALPPTRFGDDLLAYMRGECLDSPWDGPDRHRSCDRFSRPAPPAARR